METKALKKSNDKKVAGVCAGIAEYLGWKPSHVRLIFIFLTTMAGSGLLAYLILYFVMPQNNSSFNSFKIDDFRK
ncbi:MAG: PspC domain-containing protein [Bacteroidales bacterium]